MGHKRRASKEAPAENDGYLSLTPASDNAASASGQDELSNVVYIGHLPHGFYEQQLLEFFGQFGKLMRVRLSRSKKTGKAKHYAYLEFAHAEVAQIAATAMDGYFMFVQKIVCRVLKRSEVHPLLFKGANRKFKAIPWTKIAAERHNRPRTPAEHAARVAKLLRKDAARAKRIADAGIDYQYEPLTAAVAPVAKKTKFA